MGNKIQLTIKMSIFNTINGVLIVDEYPATASKATRSPVSESSAYID